MVTFEDRLVDVVDVRFGGELAPGCRLVFIVPSFMKHVIDDARRGGDEVEVVLALEPLLDDLHVEEPEEAAAKPEAERLRRVGLEDERRVVHVELRERVAQILVLRRVRREDAGEHC